MGSAEWARFLKPSTIIVQLSLNYYLKTIIFHAFTCQLLYYISCLHCLSTKRPENYPPSFPYHLIYFLSFVSKYLAKKNINHFSYIIIIIIIIFIMVHIWFHQVIINSLTLVDLKPEMYQQHYCSVWQLGSKTLAGIVLLVLIFRSVNVLNRWAVINGMLKSLSPVRRQVGERTALWKMLVLWIKLHLTLDPRFLIAASRSRCSIVTSFPRNAIYTARLGLCRSGVREYVFYVYFQISKKTWLFTFF